MQSALHGFYFACIVRCIGLCHYYQVFHTELIRFFHIRTCRHMSMHDTHMYKCAHTHSYTHSHMYTDMHHTAKTISHNLIYTHMQVDVHGHAPHC